jgi:hypothetical protein
MRTHHENTKTGKHEKGTGFFITPSSFVLSVIALSFDSSSVLCILLLFRPYRVLVHHMMRIVGLFGLSQTLDSHVLFPIDVGDS